MIELVLFSHNHIKSVMLSTPIDVPLDKVLFITRVNYITVDEKQQIEKAQAIYVPNTPNPPLMNRGLGREEIVKALQENQLSIFVMRMDAHNKVNIANIRLYNHDNDTYIKAILGDKIYPDSDLPEDDIGDLPAVRP
jgi:hypothetical protein